MNALLPFLSVASWLHKSVTVSGVSGNGTAFLFFYFFCSKTRLDRIQRDEHRFGILQLTLLFLDGYPCYPSPPLACSPTARRPAAICARTPASILCVCVWTCQCIVWAAAVFLMRMYGPRCTLPSGCRAAGMQRISLTVPSASFFPALPPSICHSPPQLSSVFLDFSCLFLYPLTWNPFFFLSFVHLDMFFYPLLCCNTLTETSVTSSCCSLGICTCWLKRCQGSVNRKSRTQRAHLNLKRLAGQNYAAAQKSACVASTSLTLGSPNHSFCIPHPFHTSFLFTYH